MKTKNKTSRARRNLSAMRPLALLVASCFAVGVEANPTGPTVVRGSAAFKKAGNLLQVVNSPKAIINWQSFSIGAGEITRFVQQSASSSVLNRVTTQNPSSILGTLQSNGRVFLINPNGIVFGAGSVINTAGLVASSLNLSNADFLSGRMNFTATPGAGSVINQGNINTSSGGSVYLVGPAVTNAGIITSPKGEVVLAAGNSVELVNPGTPNLRVEITAPDNQAVNLGQISADSGRVGIYAGLIKHSGSIRADSAEIGADGRIVLLATKSVALEAGSVLSAQGSNGADGGFIETSAAKVRIDPAAVITTVAAQGKTGTWLIDPNDYTIAASGGDITGSQLSTNLGTNNVTIISSGGATAGGGDINVEDAVSWSANTLTLTAARDVNINAVMTASGTSALALNPATANGADGAVAGGTVKTGINTDGSFMGRVDFGARSGTGFLSINGNDYTVINSLGAPGSVTGTDLQGMRGNLAGRYALGSDIDASATSGWNSLAGFAPIGEGIWTPFTGAFNGLGHTVTNLTINRPNQAEVGLFGRIWTGAAIISNVGLVGGSVVGGVPGSFDQFVGGLAGANIDGTIINSYNTGNVSGIREVGGLVGRNQFGTISNSYSTGSVTGSDHVVGGLVGVNAFGTISSSYSTGSVSGLAYVGGLVGDNFGTVSNSYSTGSVAGTEHVGGLVGVNGGTITNAYSAGEVSGGSNFGGLIGSNSGGTVTSSYWDAESSGQDGSADGTDLTFSQMRQQASFPDWDFTNTWTIDEGVPYPTLRVFGATAAASNTWLGLLDRYWTTSGNWSLGHVPTAMERVGIPDLAGTAFVEMAGGPFTVRSIVSAEPFSITGSGTSITLRQGGAFNAGLDLGAGTSLTSQGKLNLNNPTLGSGAKINLTGSGTGILTIDGETFIVINRLGAPGSVTGVDLQGMSSNLEGWYVLGSDVDASATSTWNAGLGFEPVGNGSGPFLGIFDGLGHTVSGLVINRPANSGVGLFGSAEAVIRNVGLAGGSVTGNWYVGGLVGNLEYGTISNAFSTGSVNGQYAVGGLVGLNYSGTVASSYSTGSVSGDNAVGGLVGSNDGTITNSYATGSVNGVDRVGGLVGSSVGTITGSYASGSVSGIFAIGGLAGHNDGSITDSLATGSVTGDTNVGGLVGTEDFYGTITNSYAIGYVSGVDRVGGLVGENGSDSGAIASSYWDTQTSGTATGIGAGSRTGATGLTTAQMNQQASFTGWDFTNTWRIDEGVSYPTLRVFWTPPNTWLGLLDSSWATVGNWSLGHVPTATEVVTIPDVAGTAFVQMSGGPFAVKSITSAEPFSITGSGTSFTLSQGGAFNAGLDLGAGTSLTSHGTLSLSSYTLGTGAKINLTQSGAGILTVGGLPYTVINSLGAEGSVTGTDLQGMRGNLGGRYALGSDLDASATSGWSGGFLPVGNNITVFTGAFDGLGHTVTGLTINRPATPYVGLFGFTNGAISNVGLVGGSTIGSNYVGGLVGNKNAGTIINSYSTGAVSGVDYVGGLVGYNVWGSIASSYSTGTVSGLNYVGGLVGENTGTITGSHSTGAVSGGNLYTGGLVGYNLGPIDNSYSTGAASGVRYVGGLAGYNEDTITNSYSTGSVSGVDRVGGLVGRDGGTIVNSYWNTETSGKANCESFGAVTGCTGLTTAQMKQQASFSGWDFTNTWRIEEGTSYPTLRAFYVPPVTPGSRAFIWDNESGDFLWTNPVNWTFNSGLPGTLDSVMLNLSGGSEAWLTTGTYSIGSLNSGATNSLVINGGSLTVLGAAAMGGDVTVQAGTLTVNGVYTGATTSVTNTGTAIFTSGSTNVLNQSGGTVGTTDPASGFPVNFLTLLSGTSSWTGGAMNGNLIVNPGVVLEKSGAGSVTLGGTILNKGTLKISGGEIDTTLAGFVNNSGTVDFAGDYTLGGLGGIAHYGNIIKTAGAGTATLGVYMVDQTVGGHWRVDSGTLNLDAGGSSSVTQQLDAGAGTLAFKAGTYDMAGFTAVAGSTVTFGGGTANFSGLYTGDKTNVSGTGVVNFNAPIGWSTTRTLNLAESGKVGIVYGLMLTGNASVTGNSVWSSGLIEATGASGFPALNVLPDAVVQKSGSGKVTVSSQLNNKGTLKLTGGQIEQAPKPGSTGYYGWMNEGTVEFAADGTAITGGGGLQNDGLVLKSAGTGTAAIGSRLVIPTGGHWRVASGVLSLEGGTSTATGIVNLDAGGGTLDFHAGTYNMDRLIATTGSTVAFSGGTTNFSGLYTGDKTNVSGTGVVNFNYSGAANTTQALSLLGGSLAGAGNLTVAGSLTWSGGADIIGTGRLTTNGTTTVTNAGNGIARPWTNNGTVNIDGDGVLEYAALPSTWTNAAGGVVNLNGSAANPIKTYSSSGHVLNNFGTINKKAGSAATQSIGDGGTSITNVSGGAINVNSGTLQVSNFASNTNSGTINVASGATLSTNGSNLSNASTGIIAGAGTVNLDAATLTNDGKFLPGGAGTVGTLAITGNLTQGTGGAIEVDLASATSHDVLAVSGAAALDGTLKATTLGTFAPSGQSFPVLTYSSRTGAFSTHTLPANVIHTYNVSNLTLTHATDNTWLGLVDGYWTTVGNWSLGHVPTATEAVIIPDVPTTAFVQMSGGPFTVKNIVSAEPFKLTGTGTSFTLTQDGRFNAGLDLGAGTSLTALDTLSMSSYTLGAGAKINLTQSGAGILAIGGLPYIVINSLGAAGSVTGIDLQGMRGNLSARYALGKDIDASATSSWNSGAGFDPVGDMTTGSTGFIGTLDGLGHVITALAIDKPASVTINSYGVGLFGWIATGASIRNVGLKSVNIRGAGDFVYVGGLAGYSEGTITNSYVTGTVRASGESAYAGGLAGGNGGAIGNSYSAGDVSGTVGVGGLVGDHYGSIRNSYNTGNVSGVGERANVGGLVGSSWTGAAINNSFNTGGVSGSNRVGGLAGMSVGNISDSYNTGSVTGRNDVGGLVGESDTGSINSSYNTGNVSGNDGVGGLVGISTGNISAAYNTGSVRGNDGVGGLAGGSVGSISNAFNAGSVIGRNLVGGLVGSSAAGSITVGSISTAYNTGSVSGAGSTIGGLVGSNRGPISNSYNTGSVNSAGDDVGGLVGENWDTITNSYNTGRVGGNNNVGGLVGYNNLFGVIGESYSSGNVAVGGGLVGYNAFTSVANVLGITNVYAEIRSSYWDTDASGQVSSFGGGTGLTTAQMKRQVSFSGLDFSSVWSIDGGVSYPYLRNNEQNPHPTGPIIRLSVSAPNAAAAGSSVGASASQVTAGMATISGLFNPPPPTPAANSAPPSPKCGTAKAKSLPACAP